MEILADYTYKFMVTIDLGQAARVSEGKGINKSLKMSNSFKELKFLKGHPPLLLAL